MRSPHTATKSSPRSLQLEEAHVQQQKPNAARNKYTKYIYKKYVYIDHGTFIEINHVWGLTKNVIQFLKNRNKTISDPNAIK